MNKKWHIFLTGGLACIMPNIIEFSSKALRDVVRFEMITLNSIISILLGGIIFIVVAGFLVTYILGAKDIKDAFYKGVAVPTLIISLANGVTATAVKVPSVPITHDGSAMSIPANADRSTSPPLAGFFINEAYADNDNKTVNISQGTVEFNISPSNIKNIKITIMDTAGNIIGEARSDVARFKMNYFPGSYRFRIETEDLYREVAVEINLNKITPVTVALEKKGFTDQVIQGIRQLMKR
ncbi:MAG: hypothetical protein HZC12_03310 [Nitrospirae bacterium]|nr:hypothetical protein [Nitrospirota bacterium]